MKGPSKTMIDSGFSNIKGPSKTMTDSMLSKRVQIKFILCYSLVCPSDVRLLETD